MQGLPRSPGLWGVGCLTLLIAAVLTPCSLAFYGLFLLGVVWNDSSSLDQKSSDREFGFLLFPLFLAVPGVLFWDGLRLTARGGPAPQGEERGEDRSAGEQTGRKPLEYDY